MFCDHFNRQFENWQPPQPTMVMDVDHMNFTPKSTSATKAHPYRLLYLVSRTVARLKENVLVRLVMQDEGSHDIDSCFSDATIKYDVDDSDDIEYDYLFSHRVTVTNLLHCAEILCRSLHNRLTLNSVFFCECLLNLGSYFARLYDLISPRPESNFAPQDSSSSSDSSTHRHMETSAFARMRAPNRPDRQALSQWLTHLITLSVRAISYFLCPSSSWTSLHLVEWYVPQLRQSFGHLPSNPGPKVDFIGGNWWTRRVPGSITEAVRDMQRSRCRDGMKPLHLQVGRLCEFVCTVLQAATRQAVREARACANRTTNTSTLPLPRDAQNLRQPTIQLLFLALEMIGNLLHSTNRRQIGLDFRQRFASRRGLPTLVEVVTLTPKWANSTGAESMWGAGAALQMLTLLSLRPLVGLDLAPVPSTDRQTTSNSSRSSIDVAETFRVVFRALLQNINTHVCDHCNIDGSLKDTLSPMVQRVTVGFSRVFASHPTAGSAAHFETSTRRHTRTTNRPPDILPSIEYEVLPSANTRMDFTPLTLHLLELTFSGVAAVVGACAAPRRFSSSSLSAPHNVLKQNKMANSVLVSHILRHVIRTVNNLECDPTSVLMLYWARLLVIRLCQHVCFCGPAVVFLKGLCTELIRTPTALTQLTLPPSAAQPERARRNSLDQRETKISEASRPDLSLRGRSGRRRTSSCRGMPLHENVPDGFVWKYAPGAPVQTPPAVLAQPPGSLTQNSPPRAEYIVKHVTGPSANEFEFVVRMRSLAMLQSMVKHAASTDYVPCCEVGALVNAALTSVPVHAERAVWMQERHHINYCVKMWSLCTLRDMLVSEDAEVVHAVSQALQAVNALPKVLTVISKLTPIPEMQTAFRSSRQLNPVVFPDHFASGRSLISRRNTVSTSLAEEHRTVAVNRSSSGGEYLYARKSTGNALTSPQPVLCAYTSEGGRELIMSDGITHATVDDTAQLSSDRHPHLVICAPRVVDSWTRLSQHALSPSMSNAHHYAPWRFALALARDRHTDATSGQRLHGLQKASLHALRGILLSVVESVLTGNQTWTGSVANADDLHTRTSTNTISQGLVCLRLLWIETTFPTTETLVRTLFKLLLDSKTRLFALNGLMHILAVTRPRRLRPFLRFQVTAAKLSKAVCNMTTNRIIDQCLEFLHSKLKPPRTPDDKQFALHLLAGFRRFLRCPNEPERRRRQHLLISKSIFKHLLTLITNEGEWFEDPQYHSTICRQVMLLVQTLIHRNGDAKAAFEEHIGYTELLNIILRAEPQPSVSMCTILEGACRSGTRITSNSKLEIN